MNKKTKQVTGSGEITINMNRERDALIFAQQPEDEKLICAVLKNIGYQIASCNSFDQILKFYSAQPLIIFSGIDNEKKFFHFIKEFKEKKDSGNNSKLLFIGANNDQSISGYIDFHIFHSLESNEFLNELSEVDRQIFNSNQNVSGNWQYLEKQNSKNDALDDVVIKWGKGITKTKFDNANIDHQYLSMMLDGCAYGIAIFDSQSQFIASNRNWKETIGNAIKDSDGHGQFELLSGLSKLWRSSCLECLHSKEEKKIEEEVQWANGTSEWIRWHIRPWVGEINKDEGYTVSFHSIDTEKKFQSRRCLDHDLSEAVISNQIMPVIFLDHKGRVTRSNRAAKQLIEWDPDKDLGSYYWDVFLEGSEKNSSRSQFAGFSQSLISDQIFNFPEKSEDIILNGQGNYNRIIWSNSPKRDNNGIIDGMIRMGVCADIFSDRSHLPVTVSNLLNMIPVPAWRANSIGLIDGSNDQWACVFGNELEVSYTEKINSLLNHGQNSKFRELIAHSLESNSSFEDELTVRRINGEDCVLKVFGCPIKDAVYGVAYEIIEDNKLDSANQRAARYEAQLMSSRVELERISKRNIELESRYTEFLNIADILPSSVVVISMEGKIIYANSAAILMMGNDLLECENIDNWLKRHLIVKNDENYDEIIARWNSLVWSRGLTATFPVMTEKYGESVFEFKPRIMEQGGVVMSISDVSLSVASDSGSSKSELIKNQDLNTLILSELFSDYDEVNIESKCILESRIQALGLLGSFVEEKNNVQFVRFGDYCSELLKFLILLSPADSNPQIHMNYFSFSQSDPLKVNQKIDSSEVLIPTLKSIYLALVINGIMKNIFQNVCDDNSNVIVGLSIFIDNRDSYGKVSITHDVQLDSSETFSDNFFGNQLKFIGSMIEKIDGSFELYSDLINEVSIEFKYR